MSQIPVRGWDSVELAPKGKKAVPEGLWIRCPECSAILFRRSVENNLWVCPECQHHFRVTGEQRIHQLTDPETFEPFGDELTSADPLHFVDLKAYPERVAAARQRTHQNEAVRTGTAFIKGRKVILAVMDFSLPGRIDGIGRRREDHTGDRDGRRSRACRWWWSALPAGRE